MMFGQARPSATRSQAESDRLGPITEMAAYGASCPLAARPGEGHLTEPIADIQPARRELVFMPHSRPWPGTSVGVARAGKRIGACGHDKFTLCELAHTA